MRIAKANPNHHWPGFSSHSNIVQTVLNCLQVYPPYALNVRVFVRSSYFCFRQYFQFGIGFSVHNQGIPANRLNARIYNIGVTLITGEFALRAFHFSVAVKHKQIVFIARLGLLKEIDLTAIAHFLANLYPRFGGSTRK
jgi:hypothetical protein